MSYSGSAMFLTLATLLIWDLPVIRCAGNINGLQEVFTWSQMDFNYPSQAARQQAIKSGSFVPVNASAPASIEAAGSRVFVTLPRWKNGVPATLSTVPYPSDTPSPLLTPYPSWELNRQGNCLGLTSVYRVKVDECNRLWVLDTGTVNAFSSAQDICPKKVVTFDLTNDQIINTFTFPTSVLRENSQLVTIEVENVGGCGRPTDSVLYVADTVGFALIVVELRTGRAWRVRDKSMYPTPDAGTFNVAGETFELMDGVLGLALSPVQDTRAERLLYFYAMSGFVQRWVSTSVLRNESAAATSPDAFQVSQATRSSQAGDCAVDRNGVLFFGALSEQAVMCWNTRLPFTSSNLATLAKDDQKLQFPVSVQVDNDGRVWVIATKFQSFFLGTLPAQGTNFRVFMSPSTSSLVKGTVCEARPTTQAGNRNTKGGSYGR